MGTNTRTSRTFVALALTFIGFPQCAPADLLLDGAEFQVNTYTTGIQFGRRAGSVARAPGGEFVVVWSSGAGQDGSAYGAFGRRYDGSGAAVGTEFQINSYTTDYQLLPAVVAAADGSFVVAWDSSANYSPNLGQDGERSGVFGQRYDAAGNSVGTEFQVNSYTKFSQFGPSIGITTDGGFVVAWESGPDGYSYTTSQDGSTSGVFHQRYESSGARAGGEVQTNVYTTSFQSWPKVVGTAGGGFVAVWESGRQDGSAAGIFGRRFDSSGTAVGTEFQVNTYTTSSQSGPVVDAAADGSFVVVWISAPAYDNDPEQDGSRSGVFGQRYDSAGARAGTEFRVNSYTTSYQWNPAVAAADDGSFVVVWSSLFQDGSEQGIFGQHYDSAGARAGTEFQINSYTTFSQRDPSIAAAADGSAVVVWESLGQDGDFSGMFGQLLCVDFNGNAICDRQETSRACGDTAAAEGITATDALFALHVAVGLTTCQPCICDNDSSGSITASDALRLLTVATGQDVGLFCPACA
jgi:hypothetical protein